MSLMYSLQAKQAFIKAKKISGDMATVPRPLKEKIQKNKQIIEEIENFKIFCSEMKFPKSWIAFEAIQLFELLQTEK